ncbi:hypothetical protein BS17DRAFT_198966 [Gyrodon lividus]|nr:hypothetical protein BS17DRAFT_198966 [Gyrodon lividus]
MPAYFGNFQIHLTPPPEEMSRSNDAHSPNIPYDPLPLTQDSRNSIYPDPPSPHAPGFETPPVELTSFPEGMPPSTPTPRFLGAARFDEGVDQSYRDSVASQNTFHSFPSARNSSVYALNPAPTQLGGAGSAAYRDDPQDSELYAGGSDSPRYLAEKRSAYPTSRAKSKRGLIIIASIAAAIVVIVAIVVPVYFTVVKPKSSNSNAATPIPASPTSTGGGGSGSLVAVTGGDGSKITTQDGTTFTYNNPFGGTWYWDPNDPFNNNAQANSWTPPLNQTFKFGTDRIFGVNLGGWLTTEPVRTSSH